MTEDQFAQASLALVQRWRQALQGDGRLPELDTSESPAQIEGITIDAWASQTDTAVAPMVYCVTPSATLGA